MAHATDSRLAVERIGEPSVNGQRLPFSEAVRVGDMLYLSGQIGIGMIAKVGISHWVTRQ